uniref:Ephrin-A4 n=1 Tax=Gopherus evgoodei TaxID=1825980 RepID=A0A8C4WF58_9SAUR
SHRVWWVRRGCCSPCLLAGPFWHHGSVPTHCLLLSPRFLHEDYAVQVSINDYLDIYCPHYEHPVPMGRAETFSLHMVDTEGYRGCYETPGAFKVWECNRPHAPFGPVRFSEKIQRFTPFSLGFEFQPGETYYYISVPSPESPGRCLRLRVAVCCKATSESVWLGAGGVEQPPPRRRSLLMGSRRGVGMSPGEGEGRSCSQSRLFPESLAAGGGWLCLGDCRCLAGFILGINPFHPGTAGRRPPGSLRRWRGVGGC